MNKSESIKELATALAAFQVKCGKIIKKANNPFFKSKYADLPSILDEIHLPLSETGLVLSQFPDGDGLTTILMHKESGEWIMANGTMKPVKSDPQSMGSAITYQRRYSIISVLGLNVDSDDDGNAGSGNVENPPAQPEKDLPWINEEQVLKAIDYIKGGGTMADIKGKYKISKVNFAKITEGVKSDTQP